MHNPDQALLRYSRCDLQVDLWNVPKGMRRWRGTTLKLTSCAGTQMVHSALQLSHSSALYFS